jgi:hypothetical protein
MPWETKSRDDVEAISSIETSDIFDVYPIRSDARF